MKISQILGTLQEASNARTLGKDGRHASNIGSAKFRLSLDKEQIKTPHWRMDKVLQMLEDRPNIKAGLEQIVLFILEEIKITSEDEKSSEFLTKWLELRPGIKEEIENFVLLLCGCGTSYLEPLYREKVNGGKVLDNIFHVPDPSIIYMNVACTNDDDDYWLMEVPIDVKTFDGRGARYYPVHYMKGSSLYRDFIWAIPYPKSKYIQATLGWSRDGFYGSGFLGSAVDNFDIEQEILKNWALVAKYRALGKKIIGFYSEDGEPVDMTEIDKIQQDFENLGEEDSLLVNRKVESTDLTFTGTDNSMDQQIEYLRRDTGSGLTPNYMTAFSQDSAMATAAEAKIPFGKRLKAIHEKLVSFFNQHIIKPLIKEFSLDEDTTIQFTDPNLDSRYDRFNMVSQLYNLQVATVNEFRDAAGLPTVTGGDSWPQPEPPLDKISSKEEPAPETQQTENTKKKNTFIEKYKKELYTENLTRSQPKMQKELYENPEDLEKARKEQYKKAIRTFLS